MKKLLTISIAAYNVERYLNQTLSSLQMSQTFLNQIEVLIINDGSSDGTFTIAKKWEKKYPNTFKAITKENGGHGSTLNYSIEIAQGKYFRMLDGDDWYATEELESFIGKLGKTETDLILTPYKRVYESDGHIENVDRHILECSRIYKFAGDIYNKLDNLQAHEMTIRTALLKKHRVHIPEHCYYADTAFVIYMCLYANTVIKFNDNIYRYRFGFLEQSVSETGRRRHWQDGGTVTIDVIRGISTDIMQYQQEKRNYIYRILTNSIEFHYQTFLLVDEFEKVKNYIWQLNVKLKALNDEFYQYLTQNALWKKFVESIVFSVPNLYIQTKKRVVIFGAGRAGEKAVKMLQKEQIPIAAVTDNQQEKWGSQLLGVPIVSPQEAALIENVFYFVTVFRKPNSISQQLENMGIKPDNIIDLEPENIFYLSGERKL